jgi:hypothetical protein
LPSEPKPLSEASLCLNHSYLRAIRRGEVPVAEVIETVADTEASLTAARPRQCACRAGPGMGR